MKAKIQLLAALTIAWLTSGCILPAPYDDRPVYGGSVEYGAPMPSEGIFVPDVIIVERGVRHDRYFYERHPEYYRRDRMRYPERFAHRPPSYHGQGEYHGHIQQPPPAIFGRPGVLPNGIKAHHEDSKDKDKKKKHHDDDHNR